MASTESTWDPVLRYPVGVFTSMKNGFVRNRVLVLIAWFVLTRLAAFGAMHVGASMMTERQRDQWTWVQGKSDLFLGSPPPASLAPLVRWDAQYYLALAEFGYPERRETPVYHVAFFPLYPLAVRAVAQVTGNYLVAALIVSNLAAFLACLLLLALGTRLGSPEGGLFAALLLLCNPGSHFLSLPYSESLFACLLAGALLALAAEHPFSCSLLGVGASATRSAGVLVALLLLWGAWQRRARVADLAGWAGAAIVSCGGVFAFAWFCHYQYGDALAFAHIQPLFGRQLSLLGPLRALIAFNIDPDYYLVTLGGLCLSALMFNRERWLSAGAFFLLLFPMATGTLRAMIRFQSTNVPLLMGTAKCYKINWWVLGVLGIWMCLEGGFYAKGLAHY